MKVHWGAPAVVLLMGLGLGCRESAAVGAKDGEEPFGRLTIDEVEQRLALAREGKLKFAVIDNNSESRFKQGHVPGARWVNYRDIKESDLPADKETQLVFYCSNEH